MARMVTTISCSPKDYEEMIEFYGKGNISTEIMMLVRDDICRRKAELESVLPEMRKHIEAAIAAHIPRSKAEQDFGRVFPTSLWESYNGREDSTSD